MTSTTNPHQLKVEALADHLDCQIVAEAKVEETFRCHIDGDLVVIGKNLYYDVTELMFVCEDHRCRVIVADYEWDT